MPSYVLENDAEKRNWPLKENFYLAVAFRYLLAPRRGVECKRGYLKSAMLGRESYALYFALAFTASDLVISPGQPCPPGGASVSETDGKLPPPPPPLLSARRLGSRAARCAFRLSKCRLACLAAATT